MLKKVEVEKADPFDSNKLWDWQTKYSIQNMLIRQVNFPAYFYLGTDEDKYPKGDDSWDIWSDRMADGLDMAYEQVIKPSGPPMEWNTWIRNATEEQFLRYVQLAITPTYHECQGNGSKIDWSKTKGDWFVGALFSVTMPPIPTGARIVRYSNNGGYPCHRFDVFFKGKNTPIVPLYSGDYGPTITEKKPNFNPSLWSLYGGPMEPGPTTPFGDVFYGVDE